MKSKLKNSFIRQLILIAAIIPQYEVMADVFTEYLTGRDIRAIVSDSKHNRKIIWFGTQSSGLIGFDGNGFVEYNTANSKLRENFIRSLAMDHFGNLWVGTQSRGAGRFNPDKNTWDFYDTSNGLTNNQVNSIAVDDIGYVWLGTNGGGVIKIDPHGSVIDTFTVKNSGGKLLSNFINAVAADSSSNLWFGTSRGVSKLNANAHWDTSFAISNVLCIGVDQKNNKWFGAFGFSDTTLVHKLVDTGTTLSLKSVKVPACQRLDIKSGVSIRAIVADNESLLWFGTDVGVLILDPLSLNWRCTPGSPDLDRKVISSIAVDDDGDLWFGSFAPSGVTKYTANWTTFSTAFGDNILNDETFVMARDQLGQIWIGTKSGIARYTSNTWHPRAYFPNDPTDIRNKITAIAIASDTTLWLGTFGGGVIRIKPNADQIESFTTQSTDSGLVSDEIQAIAIDNEFIWFGTTGGLCRLHIRGDTKTWDATFTIKNTRGGLLSDQIKALAVDKQGRLWCGTAVGISRYDGAWKSFTTNSIPQGLGNNNISSITVDPTSGQIWFGTLGGGASSFMNETWKKITTRDGLIDDFVEDIIIGKHGEIWFATGGGVSYRDSTGRWTNYTTIDGLADNHVRHLLLDTSKGEIWFGTRADGVTRYRRQKGLPDTEIIEAIDVTTQPEVFFRFIGRDLNTAKSLLRYSYKLDNDSWSEYTSDTFARLKVTRNGLHTFHVKAIDRDNNEDVPNWATKSFYKVAPDTGSATAFTDASGFRGLRPVKIILFWPPNNQFGLNTKITIRPVPVDSLDAHTVLAYDLKFQDSRLDSLIKPVKLTFSFPLNDSIRGQPLAIHREQPQAARLGGTSETQGDTVCLSTPIHRLGRYSVRTAAPQGEVPRPQEIAGVNAQPRIFSPAGGGHGQETTLSFYLKQDAHVRVSVYNLAGRLVDTIWDKPMSTGVNAVAWNGRDRDRRICPTGLYILTIESAVLKAQKKVMVLNE
ncbi:MAG: hypothetical protein ONB44_14455 [candidate division KSB1 bacterium]|nr:hypothetical protein [candidate division KSB1 bacterium]MDZ7303328.1 hypothetical protein [candidate division KSB1 bacterium]MDZ7310422.1 hypothetical protein [candidate division KSB1 bacterium]